MKCECFTICFFKYTFVMCFNFGIFVPKQNGNVLAFGGGFKQHLLTKFISLMVCDVVQIC